MFSSSTPAKLQHPSIKNHLKYSFTLPNKAKGTLALIHDPKEIDTTAASLVLVESFIGEYQQYLTAQEIGDGLTSWREGEKSVQKYYEDYFKSELAEFTHKKLDYWVEAKVEGKLVGWATFEREEKEKDAVYMNLLVVAPEHQKQGVGALLVHSLLHLHEIPDLSAIHLLLRTKNKGGRAFIQSWALIQIRNINEQIILSAWICWSL